MITISEAATAASYSGITGAWAKQLDSGDWLLYVTHNGIKIALKKTNTNELKIYRSLDALIKDLTKLLDYKMDLIGNRLEITTK